MTSRLKRLCTRVLSPKQGGQLVPMSDEDRRFWENRRKRLERERATREGRT